MSSPVFAQAAPPGAAVPAAQDDAGAGSEIVVTGSRIARPDLEGTSPIAVVSSQDIALKAASANIENVLNDLPQVTATTSSTSNNPGGGVATVNLRGLGSQRTLVLVDGRRYMSYDVSQVVDLNTIPASLISRVDVVTGGQSAVYGSDAIAGVVNFVLKRDFSGVELGSSYRVTERGDAQIWDINGTMGANFDDNRGNVTLFVDYLKRKPTFAGQRDFSRNALSDNQDGSAPFAAGGSGSVPQGRILLQNQTAQVGGSTTPVVLNPGLNARLNNGCATSNTIYQVFTPAGASTCYTAADGYNFNPVNYLQVPQERFLVSAMGEYEINEHFRPYFEAQFANNRVNTQLAATPISNGTPFGSGTTGPISIQTNSPYLSAALRTALTAYDQNEVTCTGTAPNQTCAPAATRGDGYVRANFNYRTTQLGGRLNQDERNAFRIVTGMKGDIGAGFSYDGYYMYARTKNSQRQDGNVAIDRFLAGVQTSFDAAGNLQCASASARAAGCVPVNIFGLNRLSPEAITYIGIGATNLEQYTTQVASFVVTNPSLVDFGAGGVGLAVGAEWRNEAGSVTPDEYLSSGNVAGFNPGQPTAGSYSVREFFGELRVPLLTDTIIHRLELNAAARASHYSNAPGNVFTWSAGGQLAPIRDLTFRGQYQKAIRGPSVNELFLGNTVSFNGNADQCGLAKALTNTQLNTICRAQFAAAGAPASLIGNAGIQGTDVNPLTFTGGNRNLREEEARTYTFGGVFQPSFIPRFSVTVDYYNIKIDGYIGSVPTDTIGSLCFDKFNQTYCNLITRNSSGQIDSFASTLQNTGGLKTSGIDITAGYTQPLGAILGTDNARLGFSFSGTRLLNLKLTPVIGEDTVISCAGRFGAQCGVPTPKWKHTLRTTLGIGDIAGSLQWRYIGKARDDDDATLYGSETIKGYSYFDLTATFDATETFQMNVGVSNLFDKTPPLSASTQQGGNGEQSNTFPTLYDVLGRAFFVSGRLRF
ncbi:TonB-dependent receptor [Sphingomonas metalli]|uniref:TonB-dependent receptor n=1 Tax=Sphingomonas metalli TaxID=1779358 RepID=A0A916T2G0_9SPHN|nr:TonB-dependent receptor [Sphingomonas metalli]GGB29288.1 TonB-dependent receptor [Sphingomonas metalli]